ncbi:MAG: ABC transporter ATP-binding protein [Clostridia bacterium]|nr:ABC transporter ATP-binding protein [Clostridia bacterium]
MIVLNSLTKVFGDKVAVDNVSFTVADGEIMGFLGPNGAGKSTTMNILTGYLSATSGEVKINDIDIFEEPSRAKKNIGFLPEQPPLYVDMTVTEYLKFVCDLKEYKGNRKKHIDEVCEKTGISHVKGRIIRNLSKGYRQRVGIAQALIGDPKVLIFDEPTVGLDPVQIIEIRDLIRALGKQHTVILSTHILSEVQAVCDRIVIINKGKIVADEKTAELAEKTAGSKKYKVTLLCDASTGKNLLEQTEGVKAVRSVPCEESNACSFEFESEFEIDARRTLFNTLSSSGICPLELTSVSLSLEDIFINLAGKESGAK